MNVCAAWVVLIIGPILCYLYYGSFIILLLLAKKSSIFFGIKFTKFNSLLQVYLRAPQNAD